MEVYRYPQLPPHLATIYVALFTEVQNAAELKKRLISASVMSGEEGDIEREAVNFAFVDARLVGSSYFNGLLYNKFLHLCRLPVHYTCRPPYTKLSWPPPKGRCGRKQFILKSFGR